MSYNRVCAFSKKAIKDNEDFRVIFLASETFKQSDEGSSFFSEPDYVYPWDYYKIIGFPLEAKKSSKRFFDFKNKKASEYIQNIINKKLKNNYSMDEISELIFLGKCCGNTATRQFFISYMTISESAYELIISKNKKIGFFDDKFLKEQNLVSNDVISYEQSLKEKTQFIEQVLDPKTEYLFEPEKVILKDNLGFVLELIEESKRGEMEKRHLDNALLNRYKTPISQTPFTFIHFGKEAKKHPELSAVFAKGFVDNIWISEAFEKIRISFSPKLNTINHEHNKDLLLHYKDMIKIIEKDKKNN